MSSLRKSATANSFSFSQLRKHESVDVGDGSAGCKFCRSDRLLHEFVIKDRGARKLRRDDWRWRSRCRQRGDDKRVDRAGEHTFPPSCFSFLPRLRQLETENYPRPRKSSRRPGRVRKDINVKGKDLTPATGVQHGRGVSGPPDPAHGHGDRNRSAKAPPDSYRSIPGGLQ